MTENDSTASSSTRYAEDYLPPDEQDSATMLDAFPIQPAELMATKQWHDTQDLDPEVVFTSADKAHVIVRHATRVRADGSPIEVVSAFYALTRTPSGWKFFALSDITVAAREIERP